VEADTALEKAVSWIQLSFRCCLCGRHFFVVRWFAPVQS
jgi:hypothetical protein